jgi:hypothetical protein
MMLGMREVTVGSFPQGQWITLVTFVLSTSPYHHGLWAGQEQAGVAPAACSTRGVRWFVTPRHFPPFFPGSALPCAHVSTVTDTM